MTFIYNGIYLRQTLGKEVDLNIPTNTTESLFRRIFTAKRDRALEKSFQEHKSQPAFTCSQSTIETLEEGVKQSIKRSKRRHVQT